MKMKSFLKNSQFRYFMLFTLACFAASQADVPGFGLILIGIWMQVANVLHFENKKPTKESQMLFLKLFLGCIPLILVIGSINAFFPVFWKESDLIKLTMINIVQFIGSFLVSLFMVFTYSIYFEEKNFSELVVKTFKNMKLNLLNLTHITFFFWGLNFITLLMTSNEYFFVLNFALTHLYWKYRLNRNPIQILK